MRFLYIVASFSHHTPGHEHKGNEEFFDDESLVSVIDDIMDSMDNDNDGYIDYIEYKTVMMASDPAASDPSI